MPNNSDHWFFLIISPDFGQIVIHLPTPTIGSWWNQRPVMAAHQCYLWWRWWSDTLWVALITLWLHLSLRYLHIVVLEISLQILKICVRLNRSPDSKVSFSTSYDAGVVLFGGRVMTWCKLYIVKIIGQLTLVDWERRRRSTCSGACVT
jgi:hypothetical protein